MFAIVFVDQESTATIFTKIFPSMKASIEAVEEHREDSGIGDGELEEMGAVWETECQTDTYARMCAAGDDWNVYYTIQKVEI